MESGNEPNINTAMVVISLPPPASESGVGYSHALDRLTGGPSATLSSPLFSSVVYSAHQGAWKGVGPSGEEPLQEQDMDTVMKVGSFSGWPSDCDVIQFSRFAALVS